MRVGEEKAERSREALIDLSEAITTSSEQKIGRRRLTASSVSGITWHRRTFTCQRAATCFSQGGNVTSHVGRSNWSDKHCYESIWLLETNSIQTRFRDIRRFLNPVLDTRYTCDNYTQGHTRSRSRSAMDVCILHIFTLFYSPVLKQLSIFLLFSVSDRHIRAAKSSALVSNLSLDWSDFLFCGVVDVIITDRNKEWMQAVDWASHLDHHCVLFVRVNLLWH